MKKLFGVFFIVIAALILFVNVGYATEKLIPIVEPEITSPRELDGKPKNSVCWQLYPDSKRKILRPQIFPVNGADKSGITQEMIDSLATIRPSITSIPANMRPFGFNCRPA